MNPARGFMGQQKILGRGTDWAGSRPVHIIGAPGRVIPVKAAEKALFIGPALASRYPRVALGQASEGSNSEILRAKGMLIKVRVGAASAVAGQQQSSGKTPQAPEEIIAMIDTGASISAIDVSVAGRLGLPQTGSIQVGGVGGMSQQPVFAAALEIPDAGVTFDPLPLSGAQLGAPDFQMLVGRNLLCQMILTYDGSKGQFALHHA